MNLFDMGGYTLFEKVALWTVFGTSFIGIGYALVLALRIVRADPGTPRMQAIALEVQKGAKAYLNVQFRAILLLCVVMAALLFLTGRTSTCRSAGLHRSSSARSSPGWWVSSG